MAGRTNANVAGGTAPVFGVIAPPPRRRKTKLTLPVEVLAALASAITVDNWIGDATVFFTGEDGAKDAQNESRIYRRDLSRHMEIPERDIRTRVWETEDGWQFALRLRAKDNAASS